MESVLLSVAKERKAQRKQTVFVDTLLQSSLTERQVRDEDTQKNHAAIPTNVRNKERCLFQIMEDCMVFTLAGCVITANCT